MSPPFVGTASFILAHAMQEQGNTYSILASFPISVMNLHDCRFCQGPMRPAMRTLKRVGKMAKPGKLAKSCDLK